MVPSPSRGMAPCNGDKKIGGRWIKWGQIRQRAVYNWKNNAQEFFGGRRWQKENESVKFFFRPNKNPCICAACGPVLSVPLNSLM